MIGIRLAETCSNGKGTIYEAGRLISTRMKLAPLLHDARTTFQSGMKFQSAMRTVMNLFRNELHLIPESCKQIEGFLIETD